MTGQQLGVRLPSHGERRDALDVLRRKVRAQADDDIAGRQVHGEGFGHLGILFVETLPPQ